MSADPNHIANYLIGQHGVDGAMEAVREGVIAAHTNRDNYRLSVWREVRRVLENTPRALNNQKAPND
jgi:hypothetical protein